MFFARSHVDLHNIRMAVERTKKVSDNLIGIGPVGIGLDGILAWVPGAGPVYSLVAGALLVGEGIRARASATTLMTMTAILFIDTVLDGVPGVGQAADMLFTGHKWSANMLLKHMDETIYYEGDRKSAQADPDFRETLSRIRSGKENRRVVFLG
jgi:hypothetical protein